MKLPAYVAAMKWVLAAAVIVPALVAYATNRADGPRDERSPTEVAGSGHEDAAGGSGPLLAAGIQDGARPETPGAGERSKGTPGAASLVEHGATAPGDGRESPATPLAGKNVKAETPAPTVIVPTKPSAMEEDEAAVKRTRAILESTKPLRAMWSDVPLQEVLQQLSKQSGVKMLLGAHALVRGKDIRVSDPLGDAGPSVEPTVWNILSALAKRHRFGLGLGRRVVLIWSAPEPGTVAIRYYDLKDLVQADWGNADGIPADDRLGAVLPALVRKSAELEPDSVVEQRHGVMIARQTTAALDRIGKTLDKWRADPRRFREDYGLLIAKRHPTVSGAPPRRGSKDGAKSAGK